MRAFFKGLRNLFIWLPVIWCDRDWDYVYLLTLMRFKVGLMRRNIGKANRHIETKKQLRNMLIVEELLKRFDGTTDIHASNYVAGKNEVTGFCEVCEEKRLKSESKGKYFCISNLCDGCKRQIRRLVKQQHVKEKADWNYMCEIFCKTAQRW